MLCPVCNSEHEKRPIQCLQQATMYHVQTCGIVEQHSHEDCLLRLLNEYVAANPMWQKKPRQG